MKEIIIDISSDGEVTVETRGFNGKSCITESQFIKDLLGTEIQKQLTPAYYHENQVPVRKYLPLCG
jgi:stress-induced morphogen